MAKKYINQVQIIVQGKDEGAEEFSDRLNRWLQRHEFRPMLRCATASSDGRQTLNFDWSIEVENKS